MKIKKLELYTQKLIEQKKFYSSTLGLKKIEESDKSASYQIGNTIVKFTYQKDATPYHYAINIPANQIEQALSWLKNRVTVLEHNSNEIQYFDFWDAYAIYFYDPDYNVVELIARKTLDSYSNNVFSEESLLSISEIGLPTNNIKKVYNALSEASDIPIYSGNFERFLSVGNEEGLFIIIDNKKKKEWFPTSDKTYASDFKMNFTEKGKKYGLNYINERLILSAH
ncbi:VOC family protein [Pseudofulvibacter geojedonensis]|uniref:VOC family protein n=1 Tax=Pseudofulvibacter geojedonensis TaxID=1123758 RepID=A0ABW3I5I8_9FLAO